MDLIREQLRALDEDFLLRRGPIELLWERCPLLIPALGFIAGILIAWPQIMAVWLVPLAALIFLAVFILLRRRFTNRSLIMTLCILAAFAAFGSARTALFLRTGPLDIRRFVHDDHTLATVRGRVCSEPTESRRSGWLFADYLWTPPTTGFYLRLTQAKTRTGWTDIRGTLRVGVSGRLDNLHPGDSVEMYCILEPFTPAGNLGQFDFAAYMKRSGVALAARVTSPEAVKIIRPASTLSLSFIRRKLTALAGESLFGDSLAGPEQAALIDALLLGRRQEISPETMRAFQKTGLAHFISLSGLHLGLLFGFCWGLGRLAGLMKPGRALLCIAVILLYILIVPPRAPTLRAAFICLFFCISVLVARRPRPMNTLALAAFVLLLVRPGDLHSPGFQLSFAAVAGILLLYSPLRTFLLNLTQIPDTRLRRLSWLRPLDTLKTAFIDLWSVGTAAWLGGLGVLLWHFHTITPLSSLWTVLVFPLVLVLLVTGYIKILITPLLPTVGMALSTVFGLTADLFIRTVHVLARVPLSQIVIGAVPLALILLYYLFLAHCRWSGLLPTRTRKPLTIALLCVLLVSAAVSHFRRTHPAGLTLHLLDMGQGQCLFVNAQGKDRLLLDAGSFSFTDPGNKLIVPSLCYHGISRLDGLFLSHDDIDHINAAPEVLLAARVPAVYTNSAFITRSGRSQRADTLLNFIQNQNTALEFDRNFTPRSDMDFAVLWPDDAACGDPALGDNDKSQVILIGFAGRKILVCGDIERFAQQHLLEQFPDLDVDVLVMPHHGTSRNLVPGFIDALRPEAVLVSCSRRQYDTTAVKENGGAAFCHTAVDGAISVSVGPAGRLTIRTASGRKLTLPAPDR